MLIRKMKKSDLMSLYRLLSDASLTHGQLVEGHTLVSLTISTDSRFLVASLWSSGAACIDLLYKEVGIVGILIAQFVVSLEIHPHTQFLSFCQRIGNNPSTERHALQIRGTPLVVVHVGTGNQIAISIIILVG